MDKQHRVKFQLIMNDKIKKSMQAIIIAFTAAAALIALFSEGILPPPPGYSDKIGHFLIFFLACTATNKIKTPLREITLTLFIILAVGSEAVQHYYLPSREFSVFDIAANIFGCASAIAHNQYLRKARQ